MNFKDFSLSVLIVLGAASIADAQDPEFSQFYANPVYTNPAFAGSSTVGRIVTNLRNQWPNIPGTFRTASASFDEHYDIINGGVAIMATYDQAGSGLLTTLSLSGAYSYQIILNRNLSMRLAVQGGITQKSIDFSKLTWYDQIILQQGFVYASLQQPPNPTIYYPNFAAGGVIYSNKFYAGFAVHNLTEPNQAFYNTNSKASIIPMRYTGHAGLIIPLFQSKDPKYESNLWPNILYMQQSVYNQLNVGMYYNRGPFVVGAYFRQTSANPDAMIFLVGVRKDKLRIGYSYDQTISNAFNGAPNSHEVSVIIELKKRTPTKTIRPIKCPEF
ncbi:MAG: type IX secretion system membrane protein PorP/SprF [Bacteroidia bacterium]